MTFKVNDRVELTARYDSTLLRGRRGTIVNLPFDEEQAKKSSYVVFDHDKGGKKLIPNTKLKKI